VTSVIENERAVTTVPKARAVKALVEKMITHAKRDSLHSRRQVAAFLETTAAVKKLFDKLSTRLVPGSIDLRSVICATCCPRRS